MGYSFVLKKENAFKVRRAGLYPWPCADEPHRMIALYADDIFSRGSNGTYLKQTGLGCFGIVLRDDEVVQCTEDIPLRML